MGVQYSGPEDPDVRDAWRHARRKTALRLHPDRGGDPEEFATELARIDRLFATLEAPDQSASLWRPVLRAAARVQRRGGLAVRAGRARLPPGWPGAQRYIDL